MGDDPKPCILFIDDEPFFAKRYRRALEEIYEVVYTDRVADAYGFITKQPARFSAIIMDIMMPSPSFVEENETAEGYETGLWLLTISNKYYSMDGFHPTVILTNRDPARIRDGLAKRGFDPNDRNLILCIKTGTGTEDLKEIVHQLLESTAMRRQPPQ